MTSEVCLMNRLTVVLAADSATTVSYWRDGKRETRYLKGANKVFQLSETQPVGLMIYSAADLLDVSWEVLIKDFRNKLGNAEFADLAGYASAFFDYINNCADFLPAARRIENFLSVVDGVIIQYLIAAREHLKNNDKATPEEAIQSLSHDTSKWADSYLLTEAEVKDLQSRCDKQIIERLKRYAKVLNIDLSGVDEPAAINNLTMKAIDALLGDEASTGIVFAGFGARSPFPELIHFSDCKFWGLKFTSTAPKALAVTYDTPAVIEGFAQTSMSDTFSLGFSWSMFASIIRRAEDGLNAVASNVLAETGSTLLDERKHEIVASAKDEVVSAILSEAREKHGEPLRRVVGVLPVDEMADLAETLINLQSLKEKVTEPSETVGGPVDVAAITRGEGFVWIKRKHYFPAELNHRFFSRGK